MEKNVLVTGAAGFIGPLTVKLLIDEFDCNVVVVDKLTYAARVENNEPFSLKMVVDELSDKYDMNKRFKFYKEDICSENVKNIIIDNNINYLINLAAESHVDRSIDGPPDFIQTEINGVHNLLSIIRDINLKEDNKLVRALFVSTDEVYGSIDRNSGHEEDWATLTNEKIKEIINEFKFTENTPLNGGSLYASCKGGADLLVNSFYNTFKWNRQTGKIDKSLMPVLLTRCVNNYGPFQHPEKLIPIAICTLLMPNVNGFKRKIPVYDQGTSVREWIHTIDHSRGFLKAMFNGEIGQTYNIGSQKRLRVRDILRLIYKACEQEAKENGYNSLKEAVFNASSVNGTVRPGHDLCYAANSDKIRNNKEIDWQITDSNDLKMEIKNVVDWYKNNKDWWLPIWQSYDFEEYWNSKYRSVQESNNDGFDFYNDDEPIEVL